MSGKVTVDFSDEELHPEARPASRDETTWIKQLVAVLKKMPPRFAFTIDDGKLLIIDHGTWVDLGERGGGVQPDFSFDSKCLTVAAIQGLETIGSIS
jgi:hypothetical protein